MNIFYLDECPILAAKQQCDKHIVKMPLESAQMLSAAHLFHDPEAKNKCPDLYKKTHINHPSTKWVRENSANYCWMYDHFIALCEEYTHRYGKIHLSKIKLGDFLKNIPVNITISNVTTFIPLCMPDQYKEYDRVKAYQNFYKSKQNNFKMTWKRPSYISTYIKENFNDWIIL